MMAEWGEWVFRSRGPVRKCDWAEGWVSYWSGIKRQDGLFTGLVVVERGEFHEEVVRVLAVDDGFAEGSLTLLEELGIIAARYGCRFKTEHGPQGNFA